MDQIPLGEEEEAEEEDEEEEEEEEEEMLADGKIDRYLFFITLFSLKK